MNVGGTENERDELLQFQTRRHSDISENEDEKPSFFMLPATY